MRVVALTYVLVSDRRRGSLNNTGRMETYIGPVLSRHSIIRADHRAANQAGKFWTTGLESG